MTLQDSAAGTKPAEPTAHQTPLLHSDHYSAFYSAIPSSTDDEDLEDPTATTATAKTSIVSDTYFYGQSPCSALSNEYSASLGSKTPMQIVAMSNHKLNNDVFSSRSLSIHRRILVKNLLTLIYELNPKLDWFHDGCVLESDGPKELYPKEDQQIGWMEQTLDAAGLGDGTGQGAENTTDWAQGSSPQTGEPTASDSDSDHDKDKDNDNDIDGVFSAGSAAAAKTTRAALVSAPTLHNQLDPLSPTAFASPRSPPATPSTPPSPPRSSSSDYALAITSLSAPSPSSSSSNTSGTISSSSSSSLSVHSGSPTPALGYLSPPTGASLPRPKSAELPQSLNSYLSAVFDVDWSVGLSNTEDSLYTFGGSPSPSSSSPTCDPSSSSTCTAIGPSTPYLAGSLLSSSPKRKSLVSSSVLSTASRFASPTTSSTASGSSAQTAPDPVDGPAPMKKDAAAPLNNPDVSLSAALVKGPNDTKLIREKARAEIINGHCRDQRTSSAPSTSVVSCGTNGTGATNGALQKSASMRKTTLVPGRRSSLMQTGQMPALSPNSKSSRGAANSNPTTNSGAGNITSNSTVSPLSPPLLAPATASPPASTAGSNIVASVVQESAALVPHSIAKRSSSLPPAKQQPPVPAASGSTNPVSSAASSRPLTTIVTAQAKAITMTWASPVLSPAPVSSRSASGRGTDGQSHTPPTAIPIITIGPKATMMSIKARRQVTSEKESQTKPKPIQPSDIDAEGPLNIADSSTFGLRAPNHPVLPGTGPGVQLSTPRQLTIGTIVSPSSPTPSPTSPAAVPISPPRSPSRTTMPTSPTSLTSRETPTLPPLFPIPGHQQPLPPSSFSPSPPSSPLFLQNQQKQHPMQPQWEQPLQEQRALDIPPPFLDTRSSSDDQIQTLSRSYGGLMNDLPPLPKSPSSIHSHSPLSPPVSPSFPSGPSLESSGMRRQRPTGVVYSVKASSKSSPDLLQTSLESLHSVDGAQRPLPALPAQYKDQVQQQYRQQQLLSPRQQQQQPQYQPQQQQRPMGGLVFTARTSSRQPDRKSDGDLDGGYGQTIDQGGQGTTTRWMNMKMMFGLKGGQSGKAL